MIRSDCLNYDFLETQEKREHEVTVVFHQLGGVLEVEVTSYDYRDELLLCQVQKKT